MYVDN